MQNGYRSPRVRFSLLWKITLPFMLLAMVLGLGATYVVDRLLNQEETDRFLRQLVDGGQQAKDSVVRAEVDLLELERLIANTEGVAEGAGDGNAEDLRTRVLPLVLNAQADVVAVLDVDGTSILTVRRRPEAEIGNYETLRGETYYSQWPFVQRILSGESDEIVGDKQAGMEAIVLDGVEHNVFFVGGPLFVSGQTMTGSVVVGQYANQLVASVRDEAGANVSIYSLVNGRAVSSTLEPTSSESIDLTADDLSSLGAVGEGQSPVRSLTVAGTEYWEVLTPLRVRQDTETLGIMGISLVRLPVDIGQQDSLPTVLRFGVVGLAMIVLIGLLLSNSIVKPLGQLADASAKIARGNLDTHVPVRGSDEIGVLSATFNRMAEGLRESSIYRDLLGRSATPEAREQLRTAISDGGALLKGHSSEATILCADFRDFSSVSETADPAEVMRTLNDYFSGVVPIISMHGGVVNRFDGDSVTAFFGILPQYLPPRVGAFKATHAGLAMLEHIRKLNKQRGSAGKPAFEMGIGISTGKVIAGGLGSEDRLQYTVVGETVSTAQRIQQVTRNLGGTALVISEHTYRKLGSARKQFNFGRRGIARLKDKTDQVMVYEVRGRNSSLVTEQQLSETIEYYSGSLPRITKILTGEVKPARRAGRQELDFLEERLSGVEGDPIEPQAPDEPTRQLPEDDS